MCHRSTTVRGAGRDVLDVEDVLGQYVCDRRRHRGDGGADGRPTQPLKVLYIGASRSLRRRRMAMLQSDRAGARVGDFDDQVLSFVINDSELLEEVLPNLLEGLVLAGKEIRQHVEVRDALAADPDIDQLNITIDPWPGPPTYGSSLRLHGRELWLSISIDRLVAPPPDRVDEGLAIMAAAYRRAAQRVGVEPPLSLASGWPESGEAPL